jgi:hypothetical protein
VAESLLLGGQCENSCVVVILQQVVTSAPGGSGATFTQRYFWKATGSHSGTGGSSHVRFYDSSWPILLQKSKVARPRIFRENTKRKVITDSYGLNRIAEVACEFSVRR